MSARHFGIAAVAVLGLAATARPATAGSLLTVCSEAAPDSFDVTQTTASATGDAVGQTIYEQLLSFKPGSAETAPGLAERLDISPDGTVYTLHLRAGVKFQTTPWFTPTRPMNADDVVYSARRMMDPKSPWRAAARNGFIAWNAYGPAETVKSVEKVDPLTVRITLNGPASPFIEMLAQFNVFSVYSAEYGAQLLKSGHPEKLESEPVGTGPWALRSYQKDAVIRLVAHPDYWGGRQKIDTLVFAVTPDANVRVQRLRAGECLVGANMRAEALPSLAGSDAVMVGKVGLMTGFIPVNTRRKWLSDVRFREALWLALDKKAYVQSLYGGRALPATSFLPPTVWGYDATLPERHDVARAIALVRATGYDGTELELATRIGGSIDGKRAAELLQGDWARIGVKVRVRMMEWGELLKVSGAGQYDLTFLNWVGGGDPDDFLQTTLTCAALAGGNNRAQWCNKAFDGVIEQARRVTDRTERVSLYKRAQRILYDEIPIIPTVYPEDFTAVNKRVKGFVPNPLNSLNFRGVSVDER